MGMGTKTDLEAPGSSMVWGTELSVGNVMPSSAQCAFGKPKIQNQFGCLSINQTPEKLDS